MLGDLMRECEVVATERKMAFQTFNPEDCRPKG